MTEYKLMNTKDVANLFVNKYINKEFRTIGNAVQQSKTIELQNIQFEVDKPWIIREPNENYFKRELQWYQTESLNVNDIPEGAPVYTTGLGNIFPSGLYVGRVSSVVRDNFDLSKIVNVKSDVNFDDLCYATIVKRDIK